MLLCSCLNRPENEGYVQLYLTVVIVIIITIIETIGAALKQISIAASLGEPISPVLFIESTHHKVNG